MLNGLQSSFEQVALKQQGHTVPLAVKVCAVAFASVSTLHVILGHLTLAILSGIITASLAFCVFSLNKKSTPRSSLVNKLTLTLPIVVLGFCIVQMMFLKNLYLTGFVALAIASTSLLVFNASHFIAILAGSVFCWLLSLMAIPGIQFAETLGFALLMALACALSVSFYFQKYHLIKQFCFESNQRHLLEKTLRETNKQLQQNAMHDTLTGVANRRHFDEYLVMAWKRAKIGSQPITLMLVDIDHLNKYNEEVGHEAGDVALIRVAEVIKKTIRLPSDMLARFSGEAFSIMFQDMDDLTARKVAARICQQVQEERIEFTNGGYITVSIGVATVIPDDHNSTKNALQEADYALYNAKANGRNGFALA